MLKILPDEVPEITPDTRIENGDPTYGATVGKLDEFVGKNVFVTLITGEFFVGRCESVVHDGRTMFTVGQCQRFHQSFVESVRET
jgi:hypothetical protein